MQQQNTHETSTDSSAGFKAGMTLDEYLTRLHAQKQADIVPDEQAEKSDSDIQGEELDHFEIRETDEDKEEESAEEPSHPTQRKENPNYHISERSPYCFNLRLSQVQNERPIHEFNTKKNFRVTKRGLSQSPQKTMLGHKGVDLFRSLYGHNFKQPEPKRNINLHGTLYSKSIFPRIDQQRPNFHKPPNLNKRGSRNEEAEFYLQEHLLSTRQLLKLRGLTTQGPLQGVEMRVEGIKDKYFERKTKSKSIKRY